jgi:acyl-CoA synthetase (AMP-forming)/AMP-acid ligase II
MTPSWSSRPALRDQLLASSGSEERFISDELTSVGLRPHSLEVVIQSRPNLVRGRSVLLVAGSQLACALALIELDGVARRIVICPPDLDDNNLPAVLDLGDVDLIVSSRPLPVSLKRPVLPLLTSPQTGECKRCGDPLATEWILFTSGTAGGEPKMVIHTLDSLSGHLPSGPPVGPAFVWSTFYDIRRYGGMQVFLRTCLGGGSLVLSSASESYGAFLVRAGACRVSHILGTPSHWRRAIMTGQTHAIRPIYVRLSGEVADQAILTGLQRLYPEAIVAHAFASTEAGVGFEVRDGREGFPADLVGKPDTGTAIAIVDDSLRLRSSAVASGYLNRNLLSLRDNEGFVDTGDMVELKGDRYYFRGRREGVINVGGNKVHPEEIESVINRHPAVLVSRVRGRRNPITGSIVTADVVPQPQFLPGKDGKTTIDVLAARDRLRHEILESCRMRMPAYKVPAMVSFVDSIRLSAAGKTVRSIA